MRKSKITCAALSALMLFSTSVPAFATEGSSEENSSLSSLSIELLTSDAVSSESKTEESDSSDQEDAVLIEAESETYVASDEEIAEALANGVEGMPAISETLAQEESEDTIRPYSGLSTLSVVEDEYSVDSIHGETRYDTSAEIARSAYPNGVASATAIIVGGENDNWPDSMASAPLAGAVDCPILYTSTSKLSSATATVIAELGVTNVIVVGGEDAVGKAVVDSLEESGITWIRIGGADRYDTQLEIYYYGVQKGYWNTGTGIVATGGNFADAIAASPLAFNQQMPLFLLPESGQFTDEQSEALMSSGIESFLVLGGTDAIPSSIESYLAEVVKTSTGSYSSSSVERLGGSTRYETSTKIATWAVSKGYLKWDRAAFANGTSPIDSLVGSVLQGKDGSVLLLISESNESALNSLANQPSVSGVRVFGGPNAVSSTIRTDIAFVMGFSLFDIEGVKIYIDAGHGYNNNGNGIYDPGAVYGSWQEATFASELAEKVSNILVSNGVDVFLNNDGGPYYYRHAEAKALGCNAIVSIHFNSGGGTGSQSIIHSYNASRWSAYLQDVLHPKLVSGVGLRDEGQKQNAIAITGGSLPAVLLEVCYIDNTSDMKHYMSRKDTVAKAIAEGILSL